MYLCSVQVQRKARSVIVPGQQIGYLKIPFLADF